MILQEVALRTTEDPEDILKYIRRDCKPFLAEGLKHPMYRGLRRDFIGKRTPIVILEYDLKDVGLYKLTRQRDRQPTGTNPIIHELLDTLFNAKFGWKARSSGVFASADSEQAGGYGTRFAFFPIGKFHSLWSPDIYDLFTSIPRRVEELIINGSPKEKVTGKLELRQLFDTFDYRADDLSGIGDASHEVMFDCDSYYVVETHSKWDVDEHPVLKELYK